MKLAINNDYFVCVIQDEPNIIKAIYPKNIELGLDDDVYTYYFYKNELFVTLHKKTKSIQYLDYELRPFVTCHILLTAISRNIPPKYVKAYDNKNKEMKLADMMPESNLPKKEKALISKMLRFIDTKQFDGTDMVRNIKRFNEFYEKKYL